MKIIIACDGSRHSEEATRFAASLPFKNPEYSLINVAPLVEYDTAFVSEDAKKKIDDFNVKIKADSDALLKKAEVILHDFGHKSKSHLLIGSPVERICESSKEADLIVMGSRGMNPVQSFFLGSVSDGLLRHAESPVLLYKSKDNEDRSLFDKSNKLVLGYDATGSSKEACSFLKSLDLSKTAGIDLISVMQISFYYGMSYSLSALEAWPKYEKSLEEGLFAMEEKIIKENGKVTVNAEIHNEAHDVADDLNEHALKNKAGMIVVGSKGKNVLDRMFLGSVSNKLAHHAELPILVVR